MSELDDLRQRVARTVSLDEHFAVVDRLRDALSTALEYARHSEGCNAPHGYPCRCRWDAERPALEGLLPRPLPGQEVFALDTDQQP